MTLFINLRFLDILDILLVAYFLYFIYNLVKGSVAINIFLGILAVYVVWRIVSAYQMEMLGGILGQFFSVGVIALIIVFQQEVRQFLFLLGKARVFDKGFKLKNVLLGRWHISQDILLNTAPILSAIEKMGASRTGALIVITQKNDLKSHLSGGETLNADVSAPLIESIFYKNNPLHDGAIVISNNKIVAAKCVLPLTDNINFPEDLGLRHRAASGITNISDALAIVVSEQTGHIAFSVEGKIFKNQSSEDIKRWLDELFFSPKK